MSGFCITFLIFLLTQGATGRQAVDAGSDASGIAVQFDCLPEGYKSTDVVSYRQKRKDGEGYITIEDKLIDLKAHCKEGKLIDAKGREIRFFKFACYGNPPIDYDEIRQRELEELEKLQKKYCVIVMECDPRIS